jgi:quinol monooxygenase YgiN
MYKVVAHTRAKDGKVREALAALKETAAYIAKHYDLKYDLYLQQFGPAHTIYVIAEYKDLAAVQAAQERFMTDEALRALIQKADTVVEPPTAALLQAV